MDRYNSSASLSQDVEVLSAGLLKNVTIGINKQGVHLHNEIINITSSPCVLPHFLERPSICSKEQTTTQDVKDTSRNGLSSPLLLILAMMNSNANNKMKTYSSVKEAIRSGIAFSSTTAPRRRHTLPYNSSYTEATITSSSSQSNNNSTLSCSTFNNTIEIRLNPENIQPETLDISQYTYQDLQDLKKSDPFFYYSIPEIHLRSYGCSRQQHHLNGTGGDSGGQGSAGIEEKEERWMRRKRNSKRRNKGEKILPNSKNKKMIRSEEQETNHAAILAIIEGQAYPPTSYNIHAILMTTITSINFTSPYIKVP